MSKSEFINKLELLPISIDYNGKCFFLNVWANAWGNLCIGYQQMDSSDIHDTILSYVVEKNKPEYIPDIIDATETSGYNEEIGNCQTLDACIIAMIYKINELAQKGVLKADYHK